MKFKINKFCLHVSDAFLAIMLVLNCHSVYENCVTTNYHIYELTLLAIILNLIVKALSIRYVRKYLNMNIILSVIYVFIIIFTVFISVASEYRLAFLGRYLAIPIVLISSSFGSTYEEKYGVFRWFIKWTYYLTIISLFFWFFGSMLHLFAPTGVLKFDWGNIVSARSYYNIYFETQYADLLRKTSIFGYRNTSVFAEGPMYGLVLDVSILLFYIFENKIKIPKRELYILLLGMVTTFSTTSYLFAAIIIYLMIRKNPILRKFFIYMIIPVAVMGAIYVLINKSGTVSYSLRMDDYISGLKTFIQSPIYGHGYNNWDAINQNKGISGNLGYSNAFFTILCQGGLVFMFMYTYPMLIGIVNKKSNQIVICIMYLFLLLTTAFHTVYLNFYIWTLLLVPIKNNNSCIYLFKYGRWVD